MFLSTGKIGYPKAELIPAAECFACILGDTQFIGYLCITPACFAHGGQAAFLIRRHQVFLQSLRWFTFLRPKVVSFYSAKTKKDRRWGDDSLSTASWTFSAFFRHQLEKCSLVNGKLILSEW